MGHASSHAIRAFKFILPVLLFEEILLGFLLFLHLLLRFLLGRGRGDPRGGEAVVEQDLVMLARDHIPQRYEGLDRLHVGGGRQHEQQDQLLGLCLDDLILVHVSQAEETFLQSPCRLQVLKVLVGCLPQAGQRLAVEEGGFHVEEGNELEDEVGGDRAAGEEEDQLLQQRDGFEARGLPDTRPAPLELVDDRHDGSQDVAPRHDLRPDGGDDCAAQPSSGHQERGVKGFFQFLLGLLLLQFQLDQIQRHEGEVVRRYRRVLDDEADPVDCPGLAETRGGGGGAHPVAQLLDGRLWVEVPVASHAPNVSVEAAKGESLPRGTESERLLLRLGRAHQHRHRTLHLLLGRKPEHQGDRLSCDPLEQKVPLREQRLEDGRHRLPPLWAVWQQRSFLRHALQRPQQPGADVENGNVAMVSILKAQDVFRESYNQHALILPARAGENPDKDIDRSVHQLVDEG
mmetsp:Transcript_42296/g.133256  ORF Transcript_42296/g.133256 Transcript_42296/m.133256 type:complete len:458 (-) Transcript_42296:545-1918(-)